MKMRYGSLKEIKVNSMVEVFISAYYQIMTMLIIRWSITEGEVCV